MNGIKRGVIMLNVIALSAVQLDVIMQCVVIVIVTMQYVVAPSKDPGCLQFPSTLCYGPNWK